MNFLLGYFIGFVTGLTVGWFVLIKRFEYGPQIHDIATENAAHHIFRLAVSDTVDDTTGEAIKTRANELESEYDLPVGVTFEYSPRGKNE